jgi:hypothetical protein
MTTALRTVDASVVEIKAAIATADGPFAKRSLIDFHDIRSLQDRHSQMGDAFRSNACILQSTEASLVPHVFPERAALLGRSGVLLQRSRVLGERRPTFPALPP